MADIKPFRGYRPQADYVARMACPPYDVLSSAEARELAGHNSLSFLHVVKPEIDLDPSIDVHLEQVYKTGAKNLKKLISNGHLVRDSRPCFYVYQQRMGGHVQAGLVAGASVDEYQSGLIKKHEHTRPDKELDRARHIEILNANTEPVFLTYRTNWDIQVLIAQVRNASPTYDFASEDGVHHTLWVVDEQELIDAFIRTFAQVPCLYVADGHHRSAAASRVREIKKQAHPQHTGREQYNYFLAVIFPHDQLQILDYNRVVKDLNGLSPNEFLARVRRKFDVEPAQQPQPTEKKTFGMYLNGSWYHLRARKGAFPADDPVGSLDVSILQDNLLAPILGIKDPRTDQRIDFVGGIRGMSELEKRCNEGGAAAAFALYPTSVNGLLAIADTGMVMPPKSTWFEPKLKSGIVVRMLDD